MSAFRTFGSSLWVRLVALPLAIFALGAALTGAVAYQNGIMEASRLSHERAELLWRALSGSDASQSAGAGSQSSVTGSRSGGSAESDVPPFVYRRVRQSAGAASAPDAYESQLIASFTTSGGISQVDGEVTRDGKPSYVIAGPLKKGDRVDGVEVLYVPVGDAVATAKAGMLWTFKMLGLIAVLSGAIMAWRTYTLVSVSIRRLHATSQALRRGEWTTRFTLNSRDEIAALANSFQETTHWLREQIVKEEKQRALFQQFVPASVAAKALGKTQESLLAGTRHPVTVMIINIRNFRLLVDNLSPDQTVDALNEYFSEINKVIVANKGIVSKYLGDTVMAVFGMPVPHPDHSLFAVRAALAIPRALQDLCVTMEDRHGWELGVGIGIASGEPIVGHFGSSEHMEYTVLGDVVIEAHHMEELTKSVPEEDTILITEETYRRVMSEVHVYDLGEKVARNGSKVHPYVVQGFRSEARSALAA